MRSSTLYYCLREKFRTAMAGGKTLAALGIVIALTTATVSRASIWINEFHYDNTGADTGEFVEFVIGPGMAINIADVKVFLYNGAVGVGTVYNTLSTFVAAPLVNGFQFYSVSLPSNGIQNGAPDGIAISVFNGLTDVLQQFLSYEGTFTGVGGPANGILSTDIGVSQNGTEPIGSSLSLVGTGDEYTDFTWAKTDSGATIGAPNVGQTLQAPTGAVPEVSAFVIWVALCGSVLVGWRRNRHMI